MTNHTSILIAASICLAAFTAPAAAQDAGSVIIYRGAQAAAGQRRQGRGMMRVAEGPLAQQLAAGKLAGDRVDHGNFQGLGRGQRR